MRAARPRVHGGIGGEATAPSNRGGAAGLLWLVDDFAAVRGILAEGVAVAALP